MEKETKKPTKAKKVPGKDPVKVAPARIEVVMLRNVKFDNDVYEKGVAYMVSPSTKELFENKKFI